MVSSSSQSLITQYDVFVSFRGEDTRNNFTGFLFQALHRNGIDAFKDNADLKKGESIAPELLQAIKGSRIYVVVFSKNYASSTWCLRELVEICNCFETLQRLVLPIFYDVDPSEVRKQSGCYETVFVEYEEKFREDKEKMEEVQSWRQALKKVADVSGWDIGDKLQHVIINEIVQEIKEILGPRYSSLPKDNLVGMDSRVEELTKRLHLESDNDVRIVGISGMSGIGKTALARALCERISHQYDSSCFIDNVSQVFQYSGALGVQKQLLCQSLNEKNIEIYNVGMGTLLASTRLSNAKRLIVFDNVEQDEQLNMFSGNRETLLRESLGGGSRVIIISRDGHILRTHTDDVYQVEPLNVEDAIQLFCRKAFKCNYIISDYEELTHAILSCLHGHPLAIEVIGSSLFSKNVSQWRCTLDKLRNNASENIMHKLRIGFDELYGTNKEIFLDIACFFPGYYYSEQYVKEILDSRGFYPDLGLPVLVDKSLIKISRGIVMPNLLSDLGKFIVKEKSPKEPRKWSRLWDYQDLHKVMSDNMEETNLEAIVVHHIPMEFHGTTMIVDALSKMRNLKLLMLPYDDIKCSGTINDLSNELGYLHLPNYPCHYLSQSFQPDKLVELVLRRSNIKQLWEETKPLHNLKHLDLSFSDKLIKIQNFGETINLESLILQGCTRLKQFDQSSGFPKNLTTLNLKDCRSLINLPHFTEAINLERLDLEGCTKLRQIDPSIGFLKKLTILILKNCKSLVSLPNNILELKSLECLSLFGCSQLYKNQLLEEPRDVEHSKKLCIREAHCHSQSMLITVKRCFMWLLQLYSREQKDSVSCLLPSLSIFSCMSQLDLSFCNLLQVPDAIGTLHSLERLRLRGNNFAVMPNLKELSKLTHLNLQHCKRLENLSGLPPRTDMPSTKIINWSEFDEYGLGLNTFNCPELAKRECCSDKCLRWIMQIVKAHHQYTELLYVRGISSIIGGSEIPRWFNKESNVCEDNIIRIDTSAVMDDNDWIGVAFCAIFVARNQRGMGPPKREGLLRCRIPVYFRGDLVTDESDHMWLFYITRKVIGYQYVFQVGHNEGYEVEVKKYGYRVLYEKDLHLSNPTMMQTETSLARKRKFSEIEEHV